jgi:hypothetical protein
MFALWMFGMEIENLWGSKKFLYYYLLCGVTAGLFQIFLTPLLTGLAAPTIGASGAIYGILIAFGVIFPNRYIFLYFIIPVKAKYLIAFMIIIEFFAISPESNIAHLAHLGGALAGLIFILLDKNTDAPIKSIFRGSSSYKMRKPFNPLGGISDAFKHKEENVQEAKYYEIRDEDKDDQKGEISQEQIDKILDKISQSGYQNLTDKEKKILFEASKKMR